MTTRDLPRPRTHADLANLLSFLTSEHSGSWVSYDIDSHTYTTHSTMPSRNIRLRSSIEYHPQRADNTRTLINAVLDAMLSPVDNSGLIIDIIRLPINGTIIIRTGE